MADKKRKPILDGSTVPFKGGVDTLREKALIPIGGYSDVQNMRNRNPGLEQRAGMTRHHSTADGGAKVLSLHQYTTDKNAVTKLFAQMADGDILGATTVPPPKSPTIDTTFGTETKSNSAGQGAASWSSIDDILIHSNGVDQHQFYTYLNPVLAFIRHDDADAAISDQPRNYIDYTRQVTDGDDATVAVLDDLDVYGEEEVIYIATPIPARSFTWTFNANVNENAAVGTLKYWNGSAWVDTTETDVTITGGDTTLGVSGQMYWTAPAAERPKYMFGISAYWYQWETDTQLSASVEVSAMTYTANFHGLTNVWDGRKDYIIEAVFDDDSASTVSNYSGDSITLNAMTTSDTLWISSHHPLQGIYIDVGGSPNTESTTTFVDMLWYWNGGAWVLVTEVDYTSGLENSGWITWERLADGTQQKTRVDGSPVYAYWYKIMVATATTSPINVSIEGMPYYEILDFGKGGTSCVWKDRAVYSFDKYKNYLYISEMYRPNVLNGDDFAIMEAGDGRGNKITCMKKFHNELMVWQKERGNDGGCLTIFEGYSPETFGKLVLSTKVGTYNPKSAVVIDGVLTSAETEQKFRTEAYFISQYGICMTDGLTVSIISDPIQNYFDPSFTECIRNGYEDEHYVWHDTSTNVLRFGIVSGTSATTCNIFPVYDLSTKTWSFDKYASNLSFGTEVEAESSRSDTTILQYGGGVSDGYIYQLNTGTNDVVGATPTTTAISSHATIEISWMGYMLQLRRLILRMKVQAAGDCTITPYRREVASSNTLTAGMTAEITSDTVRRHDIGMASLKGDQLSLKFANTTASQSLYLLDYGLELHKLEGR